MSNEHMKVCLPMNTRPANDTLFTVTNVGEATTVRNSDGWKSALTATSEAQSSRFDFNGDLLLDIDQLKTVKWRTIFGTIPTGTNYYFGLATANNATVNDIASRVLFQLKQSMSVTLRTDDGVTDSGDISTPWTPVAGDMWEFVLDFASGIAPAIPNYLTKTGKSAIQVFGGKVGQLRKLGVLNISMANYSAGLQLFSRLDKASGTSVGDATIASIEYELAR
jgi:hypothetical protein